MPFLCGMSFFPNQPFRWAIIGPGRIAQKFALGLRAVPDAKIVAVASRDPQRAKAFILPFGGAAFGNYADMLDAGNIDAVYVATPHNFHAEHSLLALERKIPVLCEKPLAVNVSQVKSMLDASAKHNSFLMEGLWTRFLPHIRKVEEIRNAGTLGSIKFIQADFGYSSTFDLESRLYNPNLAGGALLDIGIYPLFLACFLLGFPQSFTIDADLAPTGVDASVYIQLNFSNQAKAQLMSTIQYKSKTAARIVFEKGEIEIEEQWLRPANLLITDSETNKTTKLEFPPLANGFEYEAMEVQQCVKNGLIESSLFPHTFSLALMQLMDAMRKEIGVSYPFEL